MKTGFRFLKIGLIIKIFFFLLGGAFLNLLHVDNLLDTFETFRTFGPFQED